MRMLCRAVFSLVCICGVTGVSSYAFCVDGTTQPEEKKQELTREELFSKENVKNLSESLGHFIYKSLDNPLMKLDGDAVVKGLQDAKAGKTAPMTEQEYEERLQKIQEYAFEDMSKANLQEAEQFLEKNKKKEGVCLLEDGKIQYEIVQAGAGDDEVKENSSVQMHYEGKYANGKTFSSSREAKEPITIILAQTIPGFKKGMLGMKTGEKRRLYIHPDFGYGTCGQLLPNALLVFDVEVLKIDVAPAQEENAEDPSDLIDLKDGEENASQQIGLNEEEILEDNQDIDEEETSALKK